MHEAYWVRLKGALAVACAVWIHPGQAGAAAIDPPAPEAIAAPAPAEALALPPMEPATATAQVAPATALPAATPQRYEGLFGSTPWGGRGIHRLVSGFSTPQHALVLGGSTGYSNVGHVFTQGDRNTRSNQSVDLAYTPVSGLEISATYHMLVNNYSGLAKRNLEVQGNPSLRIKYGRRVAGPVALGVQAMGTAPTSALGRGLAFHATTLDVSGLVSWQPHSRIEVVGNFGYTLDRSNRIFGVDSADALQRHAYQINRVSQLPYGVGAQGRITLGRVIDLQPFVEITGGLGLGGGATLQNDPFRLSAGAKLYPTTSKVLELVVGSDVALGGRPRLGSPFGGQPAYEVFAHLHAHLGQMIGVARGRADQASGASSEPAMARVIGDPTADMATFKLVGKVLDADTNRPIFGARVVVGEAEDVLLATDDATGTFHSWPISAGPGLIRVTAKALGYFDEQKLLPRPAADEVVQLSFAPKADLAQQRLATLRGSLRDARTGKPVPRGTVTLDALGLRVAADRQGRFSLRAKPGRYTVTFEAPHFAPLQRQLTLRPDETLLFSAELKSDNAEP